jgi:hypothetical protein
VTAVRAMRVTCDHPGCLAAVTAPSLEAAWAVAVEAGWALSPDLCPDHSQRQRPRRKNGRRQ